MLFNLGKHSSTQFTHEMEAIRSDLLRMGGLVEKQVTDALESFLQGDSQLAEHVLKVEEEVDNLEKRIDEECARVLLYPNALLIWSAWVTKRQKLPSSASS